MKALYINIKNEEIQSNEDLVVLPHRLDIDMLFHIGEEIANGCRIEDERKLITDFNISGNENEYRQFVEQMDELKFFLFGNECFGCFEFKLPAKYLDWLKYSSEWNEVYSKNFSSGKSSIIIDLKELYEASVKNLQKEILRKLERDDLFLEIDEIVFNDDAVTRMSPIVHAVKELYDGVGFKSYKKWRREKGEYYKELINKSIDNKEKLIWPVELSEINLENVFKAGYTPKSVIGHDDKNYILLASIEDCDCVVNTTGRFLYKFIYGHAISTQTGKFVIVKRLGPECRYYD